MYSSGICRLGLIKVLRLGQHYEAHQLALALWGSCCNRRGSKPATVAASIAGAETVQVTLKRAGHCLVTATRPHMQHYCLPYGSVYQVTKS